MVCFHKEPSNQAKIVRLKKILVGFLATNNPPNKSLYPTAYSAFFQSCLARKFVV